MESDSLLGGKHSKRNYLIIIGIIAIVTFINLILAIVLFSKVNHDTISTITTDKIADHAVTNAKLNPNVAGRGLTQSPSGSLELDFNFVGMSHLYQEQLVYNKENVVFGNIHVVMGSNGMPLILLTENYMTLLVCMDPMCQNYTEVDFGVRYASPSAHIAVGSDGLPIISYFYADVTGDILDLRAIHCNSMDCSNFTAVVVDSGGHDVGWHNRIHIGNNGLPIITYMDNNMLNIKIARCLNLYCYLANITTVVVPGGVERVTSLLGVDGNLVLIYTKNLTQALMAAYCNDPGCLDVTTTPLVQWNTSHVSAVISGDGLPLISANGKLIHCSTITCSNFTTNMALPYAMETSLATDIAGFPVLVTPGWNLDFTRCVDHACHWITSTTLLNNGAPTMGASVMLGGNRLPFVVSLGFIDSVTSSAVYSFKCGNSLCTKWGN